MLLHAEFELRGRCEQYSPQPRLAYARWLIYGRGGEGSHLGAPRKNQRGENYAVESFRWSEIPSW